MKTQLDDPKAIIAQNIAYDQKVVENLQGMMGIIQEAVKNDNIDETSKMHFMKLRESLAQSGMMLLHIAKKSVISYKNLK